MQPWHIQSDTWDLKYRRTVGSCKLNTLYPLPIVFCPSPSPVVKHTLAHRLLSSHQGKYPPSVHKMEWNRWHHNDWNHLQCFPQLCHLFFLRSDYYFWLFLSLNPHPPHPWVPAQLHPSSGCIVAVSSMPSRLTVLAKEAQAHWKPHGAAQSQPRGEKDERGVQGEERWRQGSGVIPTNLKSCSHFNCVIFSPSHISVRISVVSAKRLWIIA